MTIHRRGIWGSLLVGIAIAGIAAVVLGCQPAGVASSVPAATSAVAACQLPGKAEKGGATLTFDWRVAVREDRPQETVILFVSGMDDLLCEAFRSPDGSFGNVTTALGRLDTVVGSPLTYDTGTDTAAGPSAGPLVVVGRTPPGTATVDVTTTDGDAQPAVLGDGFYLAWFASADGVADIVAKDAQGVELGRVDDPQGLDAGAVASPGASR